MKTNKMNVYAAGGTAINIVSEFNKYNKTGDEFAEMDMYYIDTSTSNLNDKIPEESTYLVSDLDGSGKRRDSNYNVLRDCGNDILQKFKPTDINIVVHSGAGGTGSTIGPIIVSELLSRDINVIVICVGNTSSKIEVNNTMKTLLSYEKISELRNKPVCMYYKENGVSGSRGNVDAEVQLAIMLLSCMFSGVNRELDMSDLSNFINYDQVTDHTPRLVNLDFYSKSIDLAQGQHLYSAVTLTTLDVDSDIPTPVEYQAVGYIQDNAKEALSTDLPIHMVTIGGYFGSIVDGYKKKISEYEDVRGAIIDKGIAGKDIDSTDEGIVL